MNSPEICVRGVMLGRAQQALEPVLLEVSETVVCLGRNLLEGEHTVVNLTRRRCQRNDKEPSHAFLPSALPPLVAVRATDRQFIAVLFCICT